MINYVTTWLSVWLGLKKDSRAVTALEYGLIAALIAVAIVAILGTVGNSLVGVFTNVSTNLTKAA